MSDWIHMQLKRKSLHSGQLVDSFRHKMWKEWKHPWKIFQSSFGSEVLHSGKSHFLSGHGLLGIWLFRPPTVSSPTVSSPTFSSPTFSFQAQPFRPPSAKGCSDCQVCTCSFFSGLKLAMRITDNSLCESRKNRPKKSSEPIFKTRSKPHATCARLQFEKQKIFQ